MGSKNQYLTLLAATFLMVTISGCQPDSLALTPTAIVQATSILNSDSEVQNVQVRTVNPQRVPGIIEEFGLPNCGGTEVLSQSLGTQASVSKIVEMGTTVSVSGGGEVGVSVAAKLTLETAVEAAYRQEYETANSRLDSIEMRAAGRTHVIYTIEWEKLEFSSIVISELNREIVETPYTFTMSIPKIVGSREEECPNADAESTLVPTLTPLPTYTPFPTYTPLASLQASPVATLQPTPTQVELVASISALEVGEWWDEEGVSIRVASIEINEYGSVYVNVQVTNNTGQDLIFLWSASRNFDLFDNTNFRYEHEYIGLSGINDTNNEILGDGETIQLEYPFYSFTSRWDGDRVFEAGVTDLYFTIRDLAGTSEATWHMTIK